MQDGMGWREMGARYFLADYRGEHGTDGRAGAEPGRLLPWAGPDGKACYLRPDGCDTSSALWRLADEMESVQLGMGRELLGFVRATLTESAPSEMELRGTTEHLCTALSDALRIAESRGALLNVSLRGGRAASADDSDR